MNDEQTAELQTLIATLLGRCGPELTCYQCFEQLDRYVDLTLAQRDRDLSYPGCARTCTAARPAAPITRACWRLSPRWARHWRKKAPFGAANRA